MTTSRLHLDPWPLILSVRLCPDSKEVQKYLQPNELAITSLSEDGLIEVVFDFTPPRRKGDQLISTAIHESVHVVQFVQKHIETVFDPETEAYLTQHVSDFITSRLAKAIKRLH